MDAELRFKFKSCFGNILATPSKKAKYRFYLDYNYNFIKSLAVEIAKRTKDRNPFRENQIVMDRSFRHRHT